MSGAVLLCPAVHGQSRPIRAPAPGLCLGVPEVMVPSDRLMIFYAGAGGHPVDLAHARPCGAPGATSPASHRPSLPGLPPGHRVVALGEIDGMPHPVRAHPARLAFAVGYPEICPPGEGMFWLDAAAVADVAPLKQCRPGL
jgi:hypothetical protein